MKKTTIYWIDLFCGAGGTTTGIHLSTANAKVMACVNHDVKAIESHQSNHPECIHFTEDIRDFKVVLKLKKLVDSLRSEEPGCFINIWASLECTNYSKAKGGLPRDGDSRTLANHLFMYIEHLNPDYLYIENVREFMAWGPLDENGKPISRKNGRDYLKWIESVQQFGYKFDYKLLNSADFGAFTSRERYFGIFAAHGLPISFPEATHYDPRKLKKDTNNSLFSFNKQPWKAVREVLNLEEKGVSIFKRKKELSENTHKRIYAGLLKFVAGGEKEFIKRYNGGNPQEKVKSLDNPIGSISTNNRHAIVATSFIQRSNGGKPEQRISSIEKPIGTVTTNPNNGLTSISFIKKYFSGRPEGKVIGIDNPAGTVKTRDGQALVTSEFIQQRNSGKPNSKIVSVDGPARTITKTGGNQELVQSEFMTSYYGNTQPHNINQPCPTVTTKDRFAINYLVMNEWLTDTQFGRVGQSIEKPCFTLIARMDKKPPYIIQTEKGKIAIQIFDTDNETMIKIKEFMAMYGILDIKMRMLQLQELKRIQGFPEDYILSGTQTDQKKQIGNAVEVNQATALIEANYKGLVNLKVAI